MKKAGFSGKCVFSIALATIICSQTVPATAEIGQFSNQSQPDTALSENFIRSLPFDVTGYWETRIGARTRSDPYEKDLSIGESRLQIEMEKEFDHFVIGVTTDLIYDPVLNSHTVDLEQGEGFLDMREAYIELSPLNSLDVKLGRQILTWGTGDLIFINDLFPKDFSYFSGRNAEYLKAPSDAIKLSLYTDPVNINLVYTPRFDPDRFIDGSRLSYYNSTLGRIAGRDAVVTTIQPDDWFEDDEIALRLYHNLGGNELALYAYHGFWKNPTGQDPVSGLATFPRMDNIGFSVRGVVGVGIGYVESGYYRSLDDRNGDDPLIKNSEMHILLGYEQELAQNLTLGVQYYLGHMSDYGNYIDNLPGGAIASPEYQHRYTVRLTKFAMDQNLTLSFFAYLSTTDDDAYYRPQANYKLNDFWSVELGANIFSGDRQHTYFGQFERNSNVYVTARYGF